MAKALEKTEFFQNGWEIKTKDVKLFITEKGGHIGPVIFYTQSKAPVSPYYISPWQCEKHKNFPEPVLEPLRGDFFCMPFGANAEEFNGEKHPCHGEAGSAKWCFLDYSEKASFVKLTLEMKTKIRHGKITKIIILANNENVIYSSHILEGFSGSMPVGHHAMFSVPMEERSIYVSTSPFQLGMTNPVLFSDPRNKEYQSLGINKIFSSLEKVSTLWKEPAFADCSEFPQRYGFTDLFQIFKKTTTKPAWIVAVFKKEGFLWFSLKDASVLPGTVFWISNHGRHSFPWNGRNSCLAFEDTCSYFAEGLKASVKKNSINKLGFHTSLKLCPTKPTIINYIQGVVKIPNNFGNKVKNIVFGKDEISFVSTKGCKVNSKVHHSFLYDSEKCL